MGRKAMKTEGLKRRILEMFGGEVAHKLWVLMNKLTRWNLPYAIYASWNIEEPPKELIELVEGGCVEPCRALEVGCGMGNYIIYLASKGFDGVGIDVSHVAIRRAKAKAAKRNVNCRFYVLDFLDLKAISSVMKGFFDLVMDHCCFHTISKQDRRLYLSSLKSLTHPGSLYLLWEFHPGSSTPFRQLIVDPQDVEALFSHDFKILEQRIATREYMLYIMERKNSV